MLAVLAIGGCGGSGHATTPATTVPPAPPPAPAVATTTVASAPAPSPASPALLHLRATLRRLFARAGHSSGALVYDLDTGASLFALRDGVARPPASVEKLYTTVAVLRKLGPGARLRTTVLGAGHLGAGGVWHGTLYLQGGGDPTFGDGAFNRIWEQGYGPTAAQLAHQLRALGIRRVTSPLIGDSSLFDQRPGGPASAFAPDIPDFGGELSALTFDHGSTRGSLTPGAFAARQLARTLRAQQVGVRAARLTGLAPPRARPLASVSSPPMAVLLKLMDVPSDDLFAEILTMQLGRRFGGGGTIADGARVIRGVIRTYDVHPKIVDGSGLSREDGSSPTQVVALLRAIWHTPVGRTLTASLPVVGVSGTVQSIAARTPAQGRCFAKTGTLNGVTNLAGYCAARGHQSVAFALFVDGRPNWTAMPMLGRMVGAIAAY
jgi:D-alanyl-D-alanine carboxypeptidase/D-alanyl-D-alanine-endopeptidase (penicillin-binding protein 4)